MSTNNTKPSTMKIWLTAVRPFAYTASFMTVAIGAALSHHAGFSINWGLLAVTLLGVISIHTAANLLNDCYDHRRGLDRKVFPVSGAVVRGWITEQQAYRAAILCLVTGVLCGLYLTAAAGWVVLLLGIAGAACAALYTTPGFCLKYAGLGDLAIFAAFGILPVFGTWWVQTRVFSWSPILWSIPLVMLTVGILHGNNWRDISSDTRRGCRTVAGILRQTGSRRYYQTLVLGPFALTMLFTVIALFPGVNITAPPAVLITLLALPAALRLARIQPAQDMQTFVILDGKTAQLQMLFGLLCTAGFLISSFL